MDNSRGFWGFTCSGYKIGDGELTDANIDSIADTGTSLLLLPNNVVDDYWSAVEGAENSQTQGGYVFDCGATLPDLALQIEGYSAVVPGSYMSYAPTGQGNECFGGLQGSGNIGVNIFGDVFLKAQFVVFSNADGGPQLGFAAKNL